MNEFILTAVGNPRDETIITNGLRVAIDKFEQNAVLFEKMATTQQAPHAFISQTGSKMLADAFRQQAADTVAFLERFEGLDDD